MKTPNENEHAVGRSGLSEGLEVESEPKTIKVKLNIDKATADMWQLMARDYYARSLGIVSIRDEILKFFNSGKDVFVIANVDCNSAPLTMENRITYKIADELSVILATAKIVTHDLNPINTH